MNTDKQPIHYAMLRIGFFFIVLAIALGAFSSHILKTHGVYPENIASFEIGIRYQMYSGLGLILLVSIRDFFKFSLTIPALLLIFGTTAFCITVYLLNTQIIHNITMGSLFHFLAPIGGGMMIGAWLYILIRFIIQR